MSAADSTPASSGPALRRLFLTLFLRGRSARGLSKNGTPKSVGGKLAIVLIFYGLFGLYSLMFMHKPVFSLAIYLHGSTFMFLGMFIAASAGEVLFNKEEGDILLHRPITPQALLWAKISVLLQVSLWLAGAINLVGIFVGVSASDGGWLFPIAHVLSTVLEALFCGGCVVVVYQLCLRWFGRERLDGLMTAAQVFIAVAAVAAGQILPRAMGSIDNMVKSSSQASWFGLLPPAWFAGIDDAIGGRGTAGSWLLAATALGATSIVLWLAFKKLAGDYGAGLQSLGESAVATPKRRSRRRWLPMLVEMPPLSWWLRDSVARASFLLSAAYLLRDRDVKLRVYPGLAPMLVLPAIFLFQDQAGAKAGGLGGFGISFAGVFLGLVPMLGLSMLQYSQQWQAADLFRAAPIKGPWPLCDGARKAVLILLTLPLLLFLGLLAWFMQSEASRLFLLLPGLIALPIFGLIPCLNGKSVPLSLPNEEAKSAGRGLTMISANLASFVLAGIACWAWASGWFPWFLSCETIAVIVLYFTLRHSLTHLRWRLEE